MKDILTQNGLDGKRGKWIATILEYYMEIKPTKLIKSQCLAKLMAKSNWRALDITFIAQLDDQEEMATPQISEGFLDSPWYENIIFVLLNLQAPPSLSRTKGRFLKLKEMKYCIIYNALFWINHDGILLNLRIYIYFFTIQEELVILVIQIWYLHTKLNLEKLH